MLEKLGWIFGEALDRFIFFSSMETGELALLDQPFLAAHVAFIQGKELCLAQDLLGEEAHDFCVNIFFINIETVCFFVVDFGSASVGMTVIGSLPF